MLTFGSDPMLGPRTASWLIRQATARSRIGCRSSSRSAHGVRSLIRFCFPHAIRIGLACLGKPLVLHRHALLGVMPDWHLVLWRRRLIGRHRADGVIRIGEMLVRPG